MHLSSEWRFILVHMIYACYTYMRAIRPRGTRAFGYLGIRWDGQMVCMCLDTCKPGFACTWVACVETLVSIHPTLHSV